MTEVAHLVVDGVVQAVHPHVAPETVEAVARAGGAGAHVFEDLAGDIQGGAYRHHLGFADSQGDLGAFGGGQRGLLPGGLQARGRLFSQWHGSAVTQPEVAITLLDERVVAGPGDAGCRPGAALLAGIAQRRIQRSLGVTEIELGKNQLRKAGAQRGARAGADRAKQLAAVDEHLLELHGAAVGLALAEAVPVAVHAQTVAPARQHDEHPVVWAIAVRSTDHQRIGAQCTGAEGFAAVEFEVLLARAQRQAGVAAIGGVTPEPVFLHGTGQPVALLLGAAEQLDGRHLQVLEGEQVGERTVRRGQVAHDAVDLRPGCALAAVLLRHRKGQQAAAAQQFAFGRGAAAGLVALYGAGCQLPGQALDRGGAATEVARKQVRGEQRLFLGGQLKACFAAHFAGLQIVTLLASTASGSRPAAKKASAIFCCSARLPGCTRRTW